jgi:predicted ATPase/class 3 adenylate cyclase
MDGLPSGTVTFLFTDIEGSTRLWDAAPEAMGLALARHDEIVRGAIDGHRGLVFATGGDGFAAAFESVADGVRAAVAIQSKLGEEEWDEAAPIRVRLGLHVGEVEERDGDYFGPAVNRAARIMAAGHGSQTLASTAVLEICGRDGFVSLGHHRLQGFGAPEELWQLGAEEFPPLRSQRREGNLPGSVSSFLGRGAELDEVTVLLGGHRMVTLAGVGGVGKTRLALEAARRVAAGFADGVWFVDLGPRRDADGVIEATASALGVIPEPGEALKAAVLGHLSELRTLLVMDNCEHVIDGVAALCTDILRDAAGVTVLATSREPVAITGELVWPIPSLRQPTELFFERAVEADASFAPSEDEHDVIAGICGRLDGIPLAIELAAARTRTMTVVEIRDRLDDRFRLLRGSGRGGVERHQTLQATVQWSHDLLDDSDRQLFEHLSVFPATFDATAVEAICAPILGLDEWDVRDALDRLVERNLIVAARDGQVTRYRLLETFRQFGEQRLDLEAATSLHRAHLTHFSEVAWDAGIGYLDRPDVLEPDPWILERDNIRAAMQWAIADEDHDACERLARSTSERYTFDLDFEFEEWVVQAAAHPGACPLTVAFAANVAGFGGRGDFASALELSRRAIELDDREPWAWIATGLARFATEGPSSDAATSIAHGAELLAPKQRALSGMFHALGAAAAGNVDTALAAEQTYKAEHLLESGLSRKGQAMVRGALTRAVLVSGDLDRTIELCSQTLEETQNDPRSRSRHGAHAMRAEALALRGDAAARAAFLEAIEPAIELGWKGQLWRILIPLALWWNTTGNTFAAAHILGHATANDITVARLDELADSLSDRPVLTARQQGAQMTHTELVEYILAELDPITARGTLTAPQTTSTE